MNRKIFGYLSMLVIFILFLTLPNFFIKNVGETPYQYLFRPLVLTSIATFTYIFVNKKYKVSNNNKKELRQMSLIGSLLYIIIYYLIGLAIGYSNSPMSHSLIGITSNLASYLIINIAIEFIRSSYINASIDNKRSINIYLVTFLLTIIDIGIANFTNAFSSSEIMMIFMLKFFFPSLIMNMFLSYLIYRESVVSALLYKIPFLIVYLLTPVLPSNNYTIICIIHSIIPLFIYFRIEKDYFSYIKFNLKERFSGFEKVRFLVFIFLITAITSFTTGIYPVKPVVIITGSMEPIIKRGDVVMYKKISFDNIEIGDIIVYNLNRIKVIHRVIDIKKNSTGEFLITKGDNNQTKDSSSVSLDQVLGKVILVVPKIGYPTIKVNELFSKNKNVGVETGD